MLVRPAMLERAGMLSLAHLGRARAAEMDPYDRPCLIAGDRIAMDVGRYAPQCATDAKTGIGSAAIVAPERPARTLLISAGSNDPGNPR